MFHLEGAVRQLPYPANARDLPSLKVPTATFAVAARPQRCNNLVVRASGAEEGSKVSKVRLGPPAPPDRTHPRALPLRELQSRQFDTAALDRHRRRDIER